MKLFWIIFIVLMAIIFYFLGQMNKADYEKCVSDGIMSNETCYQRAYL